MKSNSNIDMMNAGCVNDGIVMQVVGWD